VSDPDLITTHTCSHVRCDEGDFLTSGRVVVVVVEMVVVVVVVGKPLRPEAFTSASTCFCGARDSQRLLPKQQSHSCCCSSRPCRSQTCAVRGECGAENHEATRVFFGLWITPLGPVTVFVTIADSGVTVAAFLFSLGCSTVERKEPFHRGGLWRIVKLKQTAYKAVQSRKSRSWGRE